MKENLERKREIARIHFLVHPGYTAKMTSHQENGIKLLENYIKKSSTLKPNEIMIIFAHAISTTFVREFRASEQAYVQTIRHIKKILGNRLIVLADSEGDFRSVVRWENRDTIWRKIKNIIEKRGFVLGSQLEVEAYGEFTEVCVKFTSENMQEASGINKFRRLDLEKE